MLPLELVGGPPLLPLPSLGWLASHLWCFGLAAIALQSLPPLSHGALMCAYPDMTFS